MDVHTFTRKKEIICLKNRKNKQIIGDFLKNLLKIPENVSISDKFNEK